MLPGVPQTTSCKFLLGKSAFICGSIPGLKKKIHTLKGTKENNSNEGSVTDWDLCWHRTTSWTKMCHTNDEHSAHLETEVRPLF